MEEGSRGLGRGGGVGGGGLLVGGVGREMGSRDVGGEVVDVVFIIVMGITHRGLSSRLLHLPLRLHSRPPLYRSSSFRRCHCPHR